MRVLYLINFAGKAGTEKYVENLIRILYPAHIEPYLAYGIAGELSQIMAASDVPLLQINMGRKSILTAAKRLSRYCRINDIEVIHAQYPRENIIALLSKIYWSKPKVVMTNHLTLKLQGLSRIIWRLINRLFTPKNHCIIAVCREGRDIMINNGVSRDKIKLIYNGIEPAGRPVKSLAVRNELSLSRECFIITILARFAPEKGLGFLLDVLYKLKVDAPRPFCCLVCGDGKLFDEISSKLNSMDLGDCCKLLGYRKDTDEILRASDIYLCTSSHNEAMSFSILEAMNAGLPLVVTNVGGNCDLAETDIRCGYVLPYGDTEGFALAIKKLMTTPQLLAEYSVASTKKVSEYFDLKKLALDVYKSYQ